MPSTSLEILIGVGIAVGLLLFGIGTAMLRSTHEAPVQPTVHVPAWPRLIDDSLEEADASLRCDMIERLAMVNSDWSREVLRRAREDERDAAVLTAIETALQR